MTSYNWGLNKWIPFGPLQEVYFFLSGWIMAQQVQYQGNTPEGKRPEHVKVKQAS